MHRLKDEPGGRRSREPAGEMASWKSEQRLVTNGYSLLHGSSGSMIWVFPFGIWPRIFAKRGLMLAHRRAREQWGRRTRKIHHGLASSLRVIASFSILIRMCGLVHVRNAPRRQRNGNCR